MESQDNPNAILFSKTKQQDQQQFQNNKITPTQFQQNSHNTEMMINPQQQISYQPHFPGKVMGEDDIDPIPGVPEILWTYQIKPGCMVKPKLPDKIYQQLEKNQIARTAPPKEKLQIFDQFWIREVANNGGCCDTTYFGCLPNKWTIKGPNNFLQENDDYTIDIEPPKLCFDKSYGTFKGYQFIPNTEKQSGNGMELYQIEHNRNCCFLKALFGWIHFIGCLWWLLLDKICKPNGIIKKNDNIIIKYVPRGCCSSAMDIYDDQDQLKYKIITKGGYKYVYDNQDNELDIDITVHYTEYREDNKPKREKDHVCIQFNNNSNNIPQDDKAAIIYTCGKLNF